MLNEILLRESGPRGWGWGDSTWTTQLAEPFPEKEEARLGSSLENQAVKAPASRTKMLPLREPQPPLTSCGEQCPLAGRFDSLVHTVRWPGPKARRPEVLLRKGVSPLSPPAWGEWTLGLSHASLCTLHSQTVKGLHMGRG